MSYSELQWTTVQHNVSIRIVDSAILYWTVQWNVPYCTGLSLELPVYCIMNYSGLYWNYTLNCTVLYSNYSLELYSELFFVVLNYSLELYNEFYRVILNYFIPWTITYCLEQRLLSIRSHPSFKLSLLLQSSVACPKTKYRVYQTGKRTLCMWQCMGYDVKLFVVQLGRVTYITSWVEYIYSISVNDLPALLSNVAGTVKEAW